MELKWLYVRNFRNLKELSLEFSGQMNEVIGDNAQGKTSLLEAIYLCMTGSSFRTNSVTDLIQYEQPGFFVEVGFEKQGIVSLLSFSYDGVKRRISFNQRPCESQTALIGQLVGVACTPEIQNLIKGSPSVRRHFLDLQIAQIDPLYVHHLSRYRRALKQRNSLLRQKAFSTLSAWEQELAVSAAYLASERFKKIQALTTLAEKTYLDLSGTESKLELHYKAKAPLGQSVDVLRLYYEKELFNRRSQEAAFGATLVGPHRDEVEISVNEKRVADFGSEGEIRLASFALKLAEWSCLQGHIQEKPLMLIDDFGAYLDINRRQHLFQLASNLGQVFLSSHRSSNDLLAPSIQLKTFSIAAGMHIVRDVSP